MAKSINNNPCPCNSGKLYGECCRVNEVPASPGTVEFCTDIKEIPNSPFMKLFLKLLTACEGKGMKLTATRNLLRNFCREIALFGI